FETQNGPVIIESAIIMPVYVSVRVESIANDCPVKIGGSVKLYIRARRVECRKDLWLAAAGAEGDCLRLAIASTVQLQIPTVRPRGWPCRGVRTCIHKVLGFHVNSA